MDWEALYNQYRRYIWTICFRILGNETDTEDAVQNTFIRAGAREDTFNPDIGTFKSWLSRIASNLCIDMLRRRRETQEKSDVVVSSTMDDPQSIMLQQCLANLPEDQREILIMKRQNGFSWKEIAEIMSLTVDQVRNREEKAREAMVGCLSQK